MNRRRRFAAKRRRTFIKGVNDIHSAKHWSREERDYDWSNFARVRRTVPPADRKYIPAGPR